MRKRNIKTVAHWVIMSILLLFPILMVGVSSFANDEQSVTVTETYEYETNEVNSVDDLIQGNIYTFDCSNHEAWEILNNSSFFVATYIFSYDGEFFISGSNMSIGNELNNVELLFMTEDDNDYFTNSALDYYLSIGLNVYYFVYSYIPYFPTNVDALIQSGLIYSSDYLGQVTTNVDIQNATYKQEINNWCNGFKNLPVNQWYGQLLNVIGVGQTTNSVMNVIYVYPLYVLWVYLIDLIVDCLLVIIHFGHNALSRLGGDND